LIKKDKFQADKDKKTLRLLYVHLFLGVLMALIPKLVAFWYVGFLFYLVFQFLFKNKRYVVGLLIAYNLGIEIIGRMVNLYPIIPWELCKYITGLLVFMAVLIEGGRRSTIFLGLLIVLLCIPSIVTGVQDFERIVFSTFGMVNTGIVIIYFHNRKYTLEGFIELVRYLLLPLISILVYITIDTPSFSDLDFELGANFATTGGFGSNQMSTILGLGAMLPALVFFIKRKLFVYKWIDLLLIVYFLFRGLLSFSRGGVLSAIVAFVIFFLIISRAKEIKMYQILVRKISLKNLLLFISGVVLVFFIGNYVTRGALLLRYQGETAGTLSGDKEKTLNTITTGRFDIMMSDLEMWADYPIWGVGAGVSAAYRVNYGVHAIVAHTEYSRVLAEQGMFGLLILLILNIYIPILIVSRRNKVEAAFLMCLFVLAVLTSFHAGMRTFTTPLLAGMSVIRILPDKYSNRSVIR